MLATEVAARNPSSPQQWDEVAEVLSKAFSNKKLSIELTGRSCREHMDRILGKYQQDDKRALKK